MAAGPGRLERYELIATNQVHDGEEAVARFEETRGAGSFASAHTSMPTILRQLGIAHDPLTLRGRLAIVANHPLTIARALVRGLVRR